MLDGPNGTSYKIDACVWLEMLQVYEYSSKPVHTIKQYNTLLIYNIRFYI